MTKTMRTIVAAALAGLVAASYAGSAAAAGPPRTLSEEDLMAVMQCLHQHFLQYAFEHLEAADVGKVTNWDFDWQLAYNALRTNPTDDATACLDAYGAILSADRAAASAIGQ